MENPSNR